MSLSRTIAIGVMVAVLVSVGAIAVGTFRDFCSGLSLSHADGVPGCPLFVSGPRVEVAFPEDWRGGEVSRALYRDVVGGGAPWASALAVGWDEDVGSGCVAIAAESSEGRGTIPVFLAPPEIAWGVVLRAAGRTEPSVDDGASWVPVYSDQLTLPAGTAARVTHQLPDGNEGTQYSVKNADGLLILACYAETTPPDRWLSTAETLRLLPAD